MQQQKKLKKDYIQLVETFITALESEKSGAELENIRKEIRVLSGQLGMGNTVENPAQDYDLLQPPVRQDGNINGKESSYS